MIKKFINFYVQPLKTNIPFIIIIIIIIIIIMLNVHFSFLCFIVVGILFYIAISSSPVEWEYIPSFFILSSFQLAAREILYYTIFHKRMIIFLCTSSIYHNLVKFMTKKNIVNPITQSE